MKKIFIIFSMLMISSCSVTLPRITASEPPIANLPAGTTSVPFNIVDKDGDGVISKTEYQNGDVKYNNIDISTPVTVFAWIVVTMLTICGITVSLPKCITCLKSRLAKYRQSTTSPDKRDLLNE